MGVLIAQSPLQRVVGNADFSMLYRDHLAGADYQPMIVGEYQLPSFSFANLAEIYCDRGCQDQASESRRHTRDSIVRQTYNYKIRNGLFVDINTNYKQTFGFFRCCSGNLLITELIQEVTKGDIDQGQLSVLQFVALSTLIAYEGVMPESEGDCYKWCPCTMPRWSS